MAKLPCEDCLILPICINRKVIRCEILLKALNQFIDKPYSNNSWSNMSRLVKKTLRGNWFVVTEYNSSQISSVQNSNIIKASYKGGSDELFHIV